MAKLTKRVSKFTPKNILQDLPLIKHFVVHLIHFLYARSFQSNERKNSSIIKWQSLQKALLQNLLQKGFTGLASH